MAEVFVSTDSFVGRLLQKRGVVSRPRPSVCFRQGV